MRKPPRFEPLARERAEHVNPLRELLVRLPLLKTKRSGEIDFKRSPAALLGEIALHAGDSVQALNLGLAAVGNLWAIAAVEIDDGTIPMESVESFGWMLSVLSECSAALLVLGAECQQGAAAELAERRPVARPG